MREINFTANNGRHVSDRARQLPRVITKNEDLFSSCSRFSFEETHLGHERSGILMLAVRHAAIAARGCSSSTEAAASAGSTDRVELPLS